MRERERESIPPEYSFPSLPSDSLDLYRHLCPRTYLHGLESLVKTSCALRPAYSDFVRAA